ncbi:MAG: hypothetical protein ACRDJM_06495 [Actinomycetota bacterium]
MRRWMWLVVQVALPVSSAAEPMRGGIRAGVTDDPEAIFVGGFGVLENLGGVPRLALEPGGDVGFGSEGPFDYFTLRFTLNFQYRVPVGSGRSTAFPLAGVSVYYLNLEDCPDAFDCDDTEIGITFGGGFELDEQFGIQLWITADNPDITLAGTFAF